MGCRLSGDARTPEALWQACAEAVNTSSTVPEDRFNSKGFFHPDADHIGTMNTHSGHFMKDDVFVFDAAFFNLTAEAASAMDPQLRMQLECVYETFESAGMTIAEMAGSLTSVYSGYSFKDYQERLLRESTNLPRSFLTGTGGAMLSNRVSHFFDLRAPSVNLDTGCSTSLVALHLACQSLRAGESKMSIVGGSNLLLNPQTFIALSNLGLLSNEGKCFSFDHRASGYGRGDGVCSILLKPLADALRDGDPIRAVIRETGVNQDGRTSTITTPSQRAQELLIRDCYVRAGLDPKDTTYVEAHGTGTIAGDGTELNAIGTVFGENRSPEEPMCIGSIKANFGHLESASGLASIIKVAMMLEHGLIPPAANFESPNPSIDFQGLKLKVPTQLEKWPTHKLRRASISNFGYGGTNGHVIMESAAYYRRAASLEPGAFEIDYHAAFNVAAEQPIDRYSPCYSNRHYIFVLSAKDEKGLRRMVQNFQDYLMGRGAERRLSELSYTLALRRSDFQWKFAVSGQTLGGVRDALSDPQRISLAPAGQGPRLGFVFTGQGAQWFAMGRQLMTAYPQFMESMQEAHEVLQNLGAAWRLLDEFTKDEKTTRVNEPGLSFPLCVVLQICLVRLLSQWGIRPTAVTGHSSGEIAAAYASGALSFREAVVTAFYRGYLCDELIKGSSVSTSMLALGKGREEALEYTQRISSGTIVVACVNSPSSVTLSGDIEALDEVEKLATGGNVFARRLKVGAAYHSPHMQPIAEKYESYLNQHLENNGDFGNILFSSSVTGGLLNSAQQLNPTYWTKNMLQPVLFQESLCKMILGGGEDKSQPKVDVIIEIGPHGALAGPIRETMRLPELKNHKIPYASCLSRGKDAVQTMQDLACLLKMRGCEVNLQAINFPLGLEGLKPITDLPHYPWNHSMRYSIESHAERDERMRNHGQHEFLGTRIPGLNPAEPTWHRRLRVSDIPWVQDHTIQSQIVFPGSGFVCMAIEAFEQTYSGNFEAIGGFQLSDIELLNALVIPNTPDGIEVHFSLRELEEDGLSPVLRRRFRIHTVTSKGVFLEHCRGFISAVPEKTKRIQQPSLLAREQSACRRLENIEAGDWYDLLDGHAPTFGPAFRNVQSIKAADSMSLAACSVPETGPILPSQDKPGLRIHATILDTIFHSSYSAVPRTVMKQRGLTLPFFVKSVYISSTARANPGWQFIVSASETSENREGYNLQLDVTDASLFWSGSLIQVTGMLCRSVERNRKIDGTGDGKHCLRTDWAPHLSLFSHEDLHSLLMMEESDPREQEALHDLDQAVICLAKKTLNSLTKQDEGQLGWHGKKLVDWMKHIVSATHSSEGVEGREGEEELYQRVVSQSVNGKIVLQIGKNLLSILRKQTEPLDLMRRDGLLDQYYLNALKMPQSLSQVEKLVALFAHGTSRAKILEIGAGTGSCTAAILRGLGAKDPNRPAPRLGHLDFTDISSGFFERAREKFGFLDGRINYAKLDIEEDPASQSFENGTYDLVVACSVLHATRNLYRTMQNVRKLLKPGGKLIMVESTRDEMDVQLVFGTLPGWWLSEEPERSLSPIASVESWKAIMRRAGFEKEIFEIGDCENRDHYLLSVMMATASSEQPQPRSPEQIAIVIPPAPALPDTWLETLSRSIHTATGSSCTIHSANEEGVTAQAVLYLGDLPSTTLGNLSAGNFELCKSRVQAARYILWVTKGGAINCEFPESALAVGLLRTLRAENPGKHFLSLDLDPASELGGLSDINGIVEVLKSTLFRAAKAEDDLDYEFAERQGRILVPRLCEDRALNQAIKAQLSDGNPQIVKQDFNFPKTSYVRLQATHPGDLNSLTFVEEPVASPALPDHMVEIEPRAFGLNFRDVMVAMGQMKEEYMGFECAGYVSQVGLKAQRQFRVGDRVCAFLPTGHWANKVHVSSALVASIPETMEFEYAASIPVIYLTAYHSLVKVARLKQEESVLIHAAAGGVGQAAINLAQHIGAEIYASVGSEAKGKFLQDTYKIPADHILSSRDTSFEESIMAMTNGRGVDVILNSLSGPLLQASWNCIAPLGRFVEIGKVDIQRNRHLAMANFERSVSFSAVDLLPLAKNDERGVSKMLENVIAMHRDGVLKPRIPINTSSISDIRQAFRTMQAGKHVGKIVITAKRDDLVQVLPRPNRTLFSPDSSYLIVGGLGGIGASVAKWMAHHGARYIILASRNAEGKEHRDFFSHLHHRLRSQGTTLVAKNLDITDPNGLRLLVQHMEEQQGLPIRGVIHGGMVLRDALFEKMSHSQWQEVLEPKLIGTLNLHDQFQRPDLEFFITLSSTTGALGNISQAAYTAGNTFQDALATHRVRQGLPATAIDLGIVKSVGAVADRRELTRHLERLGFGVHEEEDVLHLIEAAIQSSRSRNTRASSGQILTGIAPFSQHGEAPWRRDARFGDLFLHESRGVTEDPVLGGSQQGSRKALPLKEILLNVKDESTAVQSIVDSFVSKLATMFMIPEPEVNIHMPLMDMGVDSLVATELRNWITQTLRADLSIFDLKTSRSLSELAKTVVSRAWSDAPRL
ncbi:hypothetical protein ASPZODRAFT_109969 [Penicilliopsis zonata CBS 506.65]|uniref:Uncharacterized protein n=1 Tax=Penicilliopsis zonata CBS 506.65 TaxID=1073090 RepID=A0A1L9SSB1_9EURO|nr:hypothetical protein ASPZODRAFT_109969 [Penicilliopsis zonata CBS 506.65]OJJ49991.1 hypothetical protein ASPZODRAFT_109969 [Penicilliopsis zonata CBS 506.65]